MKIFKLLICILCLIGLVGCSEKKDKEKKDDSNTGVVDKEDNKDKKSVVTSNYVDGYDKEYILQIGDYSICIPKNTVVNGSLRTDTFDFKTKDGKKVGVLAVTGEVGSSEASDFSIEDIKEHSRTNVESNLRLIYLNSGELMYSGEVNDLDVGDFETLFDQGKLNDKNTEVCNYARYDFYLNEETKNVCEILVLSNELESSDLAAIGQEMIKTIKAVE